ncbi:MAG TPA: hypothetical protein VMV32_00970 [Ignavibacteriaceae bacterium]|nr:hypothetical protein [Ignavibacteriaceae bacterium]
MENFKKIYWDKMLKIRDSKKTINGPNEISLTERINLSALRDKVYKYDSEYMIDDINKLTDLIYQTTKENLGFYVEDKVKEFVKFSVERLVEYHATGLEVDYDSLEKEEI